MCKDAKIVFCLFFTVMITLAGIIGCRYDTIKGNADVVDCIIRGDAKAAAKLCSYPIINRARPVISIDDERDFIRLFPIVFDKMARKELAEKKKGAKNNGWDFNNWQGESFVGGLLWREYYGDDRKLFCINLFSQSLFDLWEKAYKKDLATLAQKYRAGCAWAAYYFVSEDETFFGRVDSMGHPWERDNRDACTRDSDKFRVMLFRRGQKTSDEPWKLFCYNGNRKGEDEDGRGWAFADGIHSQNEDFKFDHFRIRNEEMAEMYLDFGGKKGAETSLRLKRSQWPPQNAAR